MALRILSVAGSALIFRQITEFISKTTRQVAIRELRTNMPKYYRLRAGEARFKFAEIAEFIL